MTEHTSAWEHHSKQVLGTLLHNRRDLFEQIAFGQMLSDKHMYPDKENALAYTMAVLINDIYPDPSLTITPDVVWVKTGKMIDRKWLTALRDEYTVSETEAIASAKIAIDYATRHSRLVAVSAAQEALRDETRDQNDAIARLVQQMSSVGFEEVQPATTKDIIRRAKERVANGEITKTVPTGIHWLDTMLNGGLRSKRLIGIAGGEKERKTTWLRNVLLGALREKPGVFRKNVSIALMAFENDQEITTFDFLAMLAYEYLAQHNQAGITFRGRTLGEFCNGDDLQLALETGFASYPPELLVAFDEADKQLSEAPLIHIYDTNRLNGRLRTLDDLLRVCRMHAHLHGGPDTHLIFAVDYAQLVINSGTLFDDMRLFSSEMLALATDLDATVIALSQNSREYKKARAKGEDGGVLGTKGGADLEQAVHAYMEVQYDPDDDLELLQVSLRRARRSQSGKKMRQQFDIHPASGLITGVRSFDKAPF